MGFNDSMTKFRFLLWVDPGGYKMKRVIEIYKYIIFIDSKKPTYSNCVDMIT